MGVQYLWSILDPVKTHCPLESLHGKTLAVDLSIWVCEASGIRAMTGAVDKPYLRNLFFRVTNLTKMGIHLIFVVDGDPPEVKFQTMNKRNQSRFGGDKTSVDRQKGKVKMGRSCFKAVLQECIQLLDELGIPHVQSKGEAEAFCALLNRENVVDGCLTNDGDAFVYGARTVYRNLTLNKKDPHVDCYDMTDIEEKLLLDQNKLVGLALLLGCDYCPKGVPGVGEKLAIKLMTDLGPTCNILDRFKVWRSEANELTDQKKGEARSGSCVDGETVKNQTRRPKGSQKRASSEETVKRKALTDPTFPDTKIIDEFLVTKDRCPPHAQLKWNRPELLSLQKLMLKLLGWSKEKTLERVFPLATYWEMSHIHDGQERKPPLSPHSVVKSRKRNGVSCLEVQWYKPDGVNTTETYLTTIEPEDLFTYAFPHLVEEFKDKAAAKKSRKKGGKAKSKQKSKDEDMESDSQEQDEEKESTSTVPQNDIVCRDSSLSGHNQGDPDCQYLTLEHQDSTEILSPLGEEVIEQSFPMYVNEEPASVPMLSTSSNKGGCRNTTTEISQNTSHEQDGSRRGCRRPKAPGQQQQEAASEREDTPTGLMEEENRRLVPPSTPRKRGLGIKTDCPSTPKKKARGCGTQGHKRTTNRQLFQSKIQKYFTQTIHNDSRGTSSSNKLN